MATTINGKNGTVNIKDAGDVLVKDNKTNSNYVVKNKKEDKYGYNTFEFAVNSGTDTIKGYKGDDLIKFEDDAQLKFSKKGTSNDLVITKNEGKDKITLKGYFASDSAGIDGISLSDEVIDVTGSGKINGTNYRDNITGSNKADTIRTGKGYDVIASGKGNDTVIVDGWGEKTLLINKGDGNDVIKRDHETELRKSAAYGVDIVFDQEDGKEEKAEFVYLKNLFKSRGIDGNIEVKNDAKTTVKSIIDDLYSRFDKSNSERIKSRKIEDAFGDSRLI